MISDKNKQVNERRRNEKEEGEEEEKRRNKRNLNKLRESCAEKIKDV